VSDWFSGYFRIRVVTLILGALKIGEIDGFESAIEFNFETFEILEVALEALNRLTHERYVKI